MLLCQPLIDVGNRTANPANIETIMSVLPQATWSKLIRPDVVASAEPAAAPKPTGFADPVDSYRTFLKVASRFPYFCGEKGGWESVAQACKREIATLFGHAAQETGDPRNVKYPGWQTTLTFTRESTCWPDKCSDYDTSNKFFGAAAASSTFYGRGNHHRFG